MAQRTGKQGFYDEARARFSRAADLIHINPRVRLELEEPDYEHIFYVTVNTRIGWCRSPRGTCQVRRFRARRSCAPARLSSPSPTAPASSRGGRCWARD